VLVVTVVVGAVLDVVVLDVVVGGRVVLVGVGTVVLVVAAGGHPLVSTRVQLSTQLRKAPPAELPGHVTPPRSSPFWQPSVPQSHASPASRMAFPQTGPAGAVELVELVVDVVDVLVVGTGQLPSTPQAPQQLDAMLTHAVPPRGGLHESRLLLMLQRTLPLAARRQQATAPGFPQVDLATQVRTSPRQPGRRRPSSTAAFTTARAQEM
jgi:hypothetical protein